jgi:hypothetical protein
VSNRLHADLIYLYGRFRGVSTAAIHPRAVSTAVVRIHVHIIHALKITNELYQSRIHYATNDVRRRRRYWQPRGKRAKDRTYRLCFCFQPNLLFYTNLLQCLCLSSERLINHKRITRDFGLSALMAIAKRPGIEVKSAGASYDMNATTRQYIPDRG